MFILNPHAKMVVHHNVFKFDRLPFLIRSPFKDLSLSINLSLINILNMVQSEVFIFNLNNSQFIRAVSEDSAARKWSLCD